MHNKSFEHELIKGRIAETIFEMMFRETKKFTVLHFGYEYTEPILSQYRNMANMAVVQKVIEEVSKSPDYILVTEDKQQVYIVEVKFRHILNEKELLGIAEKVYERYPICYIFLATLDNFYFDTVSNIMNQKGAIKQLSTSWVSQEIQGKNKKLVKEFLYSS